MYKQTKFKGLVVFQPKVIYDDRGCFMETYRASTLDEAVGYPVKFLQENQSISHKNVFRGFHYQTGEFAQGKLVRVVKGCAIDVVIDLRVDEPTYGEIYSEMLHDANMKEMFIPAGFAHGFLSVANDTVFQYKCTNYYSKDHEAGINPLPYLDDIQKEYDLLNLGYINVSEKDKNYPPLYKHISPL